MTALTAGMAAELGGGGEPGEAVGAGAAPGCWREAAPGSLGRFLYGEGRREGFSPWL